ncbi:hypothetical protein LCGC14_2734030 [marine sediment metagenome]|uniref:Uncharacterized protein n=1 Tax=marine sediment metagenome TaxID=412755 RepID=A0A0F8ZTS4_9ZZZZ
MKKSIAVATSTVAVLLLVVITPCAAQTVQHSLLCSDVGAKRVFKISAEGTIEWEYPADQCTDAWLLDSGNVLMSFTGKTRGAREVTPDKKVVWEYTTGSEVWGCQRLASGNTLVVECTAKRLVEVDGQGEIVKIVPVQSGGNVHMGMRYARQLANGNYLVALLDDKAARELDPSGKIIREFKVPGLAFSATRLDNGNTIIGYRNGVVEVDPKDQVVWHLTQEDVPDVKLYWINAIQRLPNGNTVVGNWFIHQRRTDSTPFFEVTPEKKVVWKMTMHARMVDPVSIQMLDVTDATLR